jgi:hypothetical protein
VPTWPESTESHGPVRRHWASIAFRLHATYNLEARTVDRAGAGGSPVRTWRGRRIRSWSSPSGGGNAPATAFARKCVLQLPRACNTHTARVCALIPSSSPAALSADTKDTSDASVEVDGRNPSVYKPKGPPPNNPVARFGEKVFHVHSRGSTWLGEIR